ncbi:glycosyltransferase [Patescibacteria group bacterium]|nr:glycosyltransferase [Patescibacteria group bacterium]
MKDHKELINRFNRTGSLVVVSSYPPRDGEAAKLNAVAWYTGNLIKKYRQRKIIVLAEIIDEPEIYQQGNVLVYRCYNRDSFRLYWQLLKALRVFNRPHQVLTQFEFNMFGIMAVSGLLPFFLMVLRLFGRQITLVQHQVVEDLSDLSGHLGFEKNSIKSQFLTLALHWFYRFLGWGSERIIVHEEVLKNRLKVYVPAEKIRVVSLGLAPVEKRPYKAKSRQKYDLAQKETVLLLFGYLTWYKGTDWLIKQVGQIARNRPELNLKLMVAGGPSTTLNHKRHYQRFLVRVRAMAAKYSRVVKMVGYVPEAEVGSVFAASDLIVLPYRAMMSGSGPLAVALQYKKPFIFSQVLEDALRNEDITQEMISLGISKKEIVFPLTQKGLEKKLVCFAQSKEYRQRLATLSGRLAGRRSWEKIVEDYERVISEINQPPKLAFRIQSFFKLIFRSLVKS